LPGMVKKPEPPKPIEWDIYKFAAKLRTLGTVEAINEHEAIEKAAKEFNQPATRLMAVRRR